MPECELVHQSEGRTTKDRNLATGLQPTTSAQFVALLAARRICTDRSGDEVMRKASTELLEQGTQTPSPAPDLIPAETKNQPRTHIGIGTVNGGTSLSGDQQEQIKRLQEQMQADDAVASQAKSDAHKQGLELGLGMGAGSTVLLLMLIFAARKLTGSSKKPLAHGASA